MNDNQDFSTVCFDLEAANAATMEDPGFSLVGHLTAAAVPSQTSAAPSKPRPMKSAEARAKLKAARKRGRKGRAR